MINYQVNDVLFLSNKKLINNGHRNMKMPISYTLKMQSFYEQEIVDKYADIEIKDCDSETKSPEVLVMDTNNVFKNKFTSVNTYTMNIIKIPTTQADKIKTFYLSQLVTSSSPQDFVLDNSLELYRLREENKQLKQEIARLKYQSNAR